MIICEFDGTSFTASIQTNSTDIYFYIVDTNIRYTYVFTTTLENPTESIFNSVVNFVSKTSINVDDFIQKSSDISKVSIFPCADILVTQFSILFKDKHLLYAIIEAAKELSFKENGNLGYSYCDMCDNARINDELTDDNDLSYCTVGSVSGKYRVMIGSGDGKPLRVLFEHLEGNNWTTVGVYNPPFCPNCGREVTEYKMKECQ